MGSPWWTASTKARPLRPWVRNGAPAQGGPSRAVGSACQEHSQSLCPLLGLLSSFWDSPRKSESHGPVVHPPPPGMCSLNAASATFKLCLSPIPWKARVRQLYLSPSRFALINLLSTSCRLAMPGMDVLLAGRGHSSGILYALIPRPSTPISPWLPTWRNIIRHTAIARALWFPHAHATCAGVVGAFRCNDALHLRSCHVCWYTLGYEV